MKGAFEFKVCFPDGQNLRLDGLGDRSDLVDLKQETVAGFFLDSGLDTKGVCDSEVVTDNLNATLGGEMGPSLPIVLVKGVLDGDDGVLVNVAQVEVCELFTGKPILGVGIGILKVEIIFAILVELRGGNIESNLDLSLITGFLDGLGEEFKRLVCARHVRSKSSFITNIDS